MDVELGFYRLKRGRRSGRGHVVVRGEREWGGEVVD